MFLDQADKHTGAHGSLIDSGALFCSAALDFMFILFFVVTSLDICKRVCGCKGRVRAAANGPRASPGLQVARASPSPGPRGSGGA